MQLTTGNPLREGTECEEGFQMGAPGETSQEQEHAALSYFHVSEPEFSSLVY